MASRDGGDCPCRSSKLLTNLWTAAGHGDVARLEHLLDRHGAVADKADEYGHSPLHFAAHAGHVRAVSLLLQRGADANARACGCAPLHRAAYAGHADVVRLLLVAGAVLNGRDDSIGDGRTPLHKAASQGHAAVVRLLLDAGAPIDALDARGLRPCDLAVACGHVAATDAFRRVAARTP